MCGAIHSEAPIEASEGMLFIIFWRESNFFLFSGVNLKFISWNPPRKYCLFNTAPYCQLYINEAKRIAIKSGKILLS